MSTYYTDLKNISECLKLDPSFKTLFHEKRITVATAERIFTRCTNCLRSSGGQCDFRSISDLLHHYKINVLWEQSTEPIPYSNALGYAMFDLYIQGSSITQEQATYLDEANTSNEANTRKYARWLLDNMGPNKYKAIGYLESYVTVPKYGTIIAMKINTAFTPQEVEEAQNKGLTVDGVYLYNAPMLSWYLEHNSKFLSTLGINSVQDLVRMIQRRNLQDNSKWLCLIDFLFLDPSMERTMNCNIIVPAEVLPYFTS